MKISLVRALVLHFADLAGWEGDRYSVTLSRRTFDRAAAKYREEGANPDLDYGATLIWHKDQPDPTPITWINLEANNTFARLARTCAHEALHAARPSMRHGRAFDHAVAELLRGKEP